MPALQTSVMANGPTSSVVCVTTGVAADAVPGIRALNAATTTMTSSFLMVFSLPFDGRDVGPSGVPGPDCGRSSSRDAQRALKAQYYPLKKMEFRLLGPLEVSCAGRRVQLGGHKQRALLVALVLNANRVVATHRLVDMLWGEEFPTTAVHALHVYLSQLRKALKAAGSTARIRTHPAGYQVELDPDELDVTRFEHLVVAGREALTRSSAQTA